MLEVTTLGNCATQTATHECVNLVVTANGSHRILIDAGPGVVRQLCRASLACTDIEYVILTHCHGDHVLGYPYFMFGQYMDRFARRTGPSVVRVVGLRSVLDGVREMLEFCYMPSSWPFQIEEIEVSSEGKTELELGEFRVTTVPVSHQVPNIGVRIEFEERSFAYSSDTLPDQRFIDVAQAADLLFHEAMFLENMKQMSEQTKHATAKDAAYVALHSGVSRLGLVHVMAALVDRMEALVSEAAQSFVGDVFVPAELSVITV